MRQQHNGLLSLPPRLLTAPDFVCYESSENAWMSREIRCQRLQCQREVRETGRVPRPRERIDVNLVISPKLWFLFQSHSGKKRRLGSVITQMSGQRVSFKMGSLMFLTLCYFLTPKQCSLLPFVNHILNFSKLFWGAQIPSVNKK